MAKPSIELQKLSKRYQLGAIGASTLRESLGHWCEKILKPEGPAVEKEGILWALRDVSLEINQGDVIGIIGKNGAGKSTLLKILSKITEPTRGKAIIRGRVASLLEVGTGFHPELSGRENIFLNGALLGMQKREVQKKFDEIVAFAEVEKFVDTPVKRYSSGMYVRLAFAVAAHLEPEILLVDEVLAVGDAAFQKKCLGKMNRVAKEEGRTILFVSHNMDAIRRLCPQSIWLDDGRVQVRDESSKCVSQYLLKDIREGGEVIFNPSHQLATGMPVKLHSVRLFDDQGNMTNCFSRKSSIRVEIDWESTEKLYKPRLGFVLQTADGIDVMMGFDATSWKSEELSTGRRISSCHIPKELLNEGAYVLDIGADSPNRYDFNRGRTGAVIRFEVEDDRTLHNKYYGDEGFRDRRWHGVLLLDIPWKQERVD